MKLSNLCLLFLFFTVVFDKGGGGGGGGGGSGGGSQGSGAGGSQGSGAGGSGSQNNQGSSGSQNNQGSSASAGTNNPGGGSSTSGSVSQNNQGSSASPGTNNPGGGCQSCSNCQNGICICDSPLTPTADRKSCTSCGISNCFACSKTNYGICDQCASNFHWDGSKCAIAISHCLQGTSASCQQCETGYQLSSDSKSCILRASGTGESCNSCSNCQNGICICDSPLTPTADRKSCTSCEISNCLACNKTNYGICDQCDSNFHWDGSKCSVSSIIISHCLQSTSSSCQKCESGYKVSSDAKSCEFDLSQNCSSSKNFEESSSLYLAECRKLANSSNPCGPGLNYLFSSFDITKNDFRVPIFKADIENAQIINNYTYPGNIFVQTSQKEVEDSTLLIYESFENLTSGYGTSIGIGLGFNYLLGFFSLDANYLTIVKNLKEEHQNLIENSYIKEVIKLTMNTDYLLDENFQKEIDRLPLVYDYDQYKKFLVKYGTHFISKLTLGGKIHLRSLFDRCITTTQVQNGKVVEGFIDFFGKIKSAGAYSSFSSYVSSSEQIKYSFHVDVDGGNSQMFCCPNCDMSAWAESVFQNPIPISLDLTDMYFLIEDATKMKNLKNATQIYIEELGSQIDLSSDFKCNLNLANFSENFGVEKVFLIFIFLVMMFF